MNLSFLNAVSVIATQFYDRESTETDLVITYHYVSDDEAQLLTKKYAIDMYKLNCDKSRGTCSFKKSFGVIS